jgi:hypothetical protein
MPDWIDLQGRPSGTPLADGALRWAFVYRLMMPPGAVVVLAEGAVAGPVRSGLESAGPGPAHWERAQVALLAGVSASDGPGFDQLLAAAAQRLHPGDLLLGHLAHGGHWRRLADAAGLAARAGLGRAAALAPLSINRLQRSLARHGFGDAELYFVSPSAEGPTALVPVAHVPPVDAHLPGLRARLLRSGWRGLWAPALFFRAARAASGRDSDAGRPG